MNNMKIFISPEEIEASLTSLGNPGNRAEVDVWLAAQLAIHLMRGGTIERAYKQKDCPHIEIDTNYHCLNCDKFMDE